MIEPKLLEFMVFFKKAGADGLAAIALRLLPCQRTGAGGRISNDGAQSSKRCGDQSPRIRQGRRLAQ